MSWQKKASAKDFSAMYECKLQRTQLNNYCKNKVGRVDLHTLAKICNCLQCDVADILKLKDVEEDQNE